MTLAEAKLTLRDVLTDAEIEEVKHALDFRRDDLEKELKRCADRKLSGAIADIIERIARHDGDDAAHGLARLFSPVAKADDQADALRDRERREREQQDEFPFEGENPPLSVDEAIEEAKREVAARIRAERIDAILLEIAPAVERGSIVTDEKLLAAIHTRFDQVEYIDVDGDKGEKKFPRIHKAYFNDGHSPTVVWCGCTAGEIESTRALKVGFYFDVLPDEFNPANYLPTMGVDSLVSAYRRLLELLAAEQGVAEPVEA